MIMTPLWSGHQDSNLGPPGPKPGALPGCATPRPCLLFRPSIRIGIVKCFRGEGGIRTLGTSFEVRRFSKPLVSATHPPHRSKKRVANV